VSPSLLPKYLGGVQDKEMYRCVEKAKQLDNHFLRNIENARYVNENDTSNKRTVLFIASCLGRFTLRALEKNESKNWLNLTKMNVKYFT